MIHTVAMDAHTDLDSLRRLLERMNESGQDPQVSGIDRSGGTFLAALSGYDPDEIVIVRGNPWDVEIEWGEGCNECGSQRGAVRPGEQIQFPAFTIRERTEF